MSAGTSSSSRMESLNNSCVTVPEGAVRSLTQAGEGVGRFVVSSEDMMELEIIELFLQAPNLLSTCHDAGVMTVQLSHDLVDDELKVVADVQPLNPEPGGEA
jgi:hypothetical protein